MDLLLALLHHLLLTLLNCLLALLNLLLALLYRVLALFELLLLPLPHLLHLLLTLLVLDILRLRWRTSDIGSDCSRRPSQGLRRGLGWRGRLLHPHLLLPDFLPQLASLIRRHRTPLLRLQLLLTLLQLLTEFLPCSGWRCEGLRRR